MEMVDSTTFRWTYLVRSRFGLAPLHVHDYVWDEGKGATTFFPLKGEIAFGTQRLYLLIIGHLAPQVSMDLGAQ